MPPRTEAVCGLVLGAGGSKRLGRPKQLLPYADGTLLGHVVGVARACAFAQTIVAIGGAADDVRSQVDLADVEVVVNDAYGEGCSSSIAAALAVVDERCDTLVLMLGDQPGVTPDTVGGAAGRARRRGRWPSAATTTGAGTRSRSTAACSASWRTSTGTRACGGCWTVATSARCASRGRSRSTSTRSRTTKRVLASA